MNRYVVGFIDFAVNELLLEIVEGIDWKDAIINSSIVSLPEIGICTLEELKVEMWNSDCMVNIIEIPSEITTGNSLTKIIEAARHE